MKLLHWLRGWLPKRLAELRTRVEFDDKEIRYILPDSRIHTVAWADLRRVGVETTSWGPFIEDVYYYLEGTECGFHVPQSAEGAPLLVERLLTLPGFNANAFSTAMFSTADARFDCWQRSGLES
jgi:hypothetical protein